MTYPTSGTNRNRAVIASPEPEQQRSASSKDTRRWCLGVDGREHDLVWQFWFDTWRFSTPRDYQRRVCLSCGKMFGTRVIRSDRPPSSQSAKDA